MRRPSEPLFLARRTYRHRRLVDALRLVPVAGAILFMVPVLGASGHPSSTFGGAVYLFAAWAFLIVLTGFLNRRIDPGEAGGAGGEGPGEEGGEGSAPGPGPGGDGG